MGKRPEIVTEKVANDDQKNDRKYRNWERSRRAAVRLHGSTIWGGRSIEEEKMTNTMVQLWGGRKCQLR